MIDEPRVQVTIQRIVTMWTKRTRGAAGREARARLPRAYPLPDAILVSTRPCVQHVVRRSQWDDYAPEEGWHERNGLGMGPGVAPQSLELTLEGDELLLAFTPTAECGRPGRPARKLRIPAGTSARYNGRFVGWDDPWYEEKRIHVAFRMPRSRTLLAGSEPDAELNAMVDLF